MMKNGRGFTLVELVMAMFITSIIALAPSCPARRNLSISAGVLTRRSSQRISEQSSTLTLGNRRRRILTNCIGRVRRPSHWLRVEISGSGVSVRKGV